MHSDLFCVIVWQESDSVRRKVNVAKNVFDTLYYLAEHVAMFIDFKIFTAQSWNAVFLWTNKEV